MKTQVPAKPWKLRLFADHGQIHLVDESFSASFESAWTAQATEDRLAVAEGGIAIGTHDTADVAVTIERLPAAPGAPDLEKDVEHMTEGSVSIPSGKLVAMGRTDYFADAKRLAVGAGAYRVRVSHSGITRARDVRLRALWLAGFGALLAGACGGRSGLLVGMEGSGSGASTSTTGSSASSGSTGTVATSSTGNSASSTSSSVTTSTGSGFTTSSSSVSTTGASSGTTASSSSGPTWTPLQLPGLVLWLDGSDGLSPAGGGNGLVWLDRSGLHNDAASVGSPTIVAGAIGGRPAVSLDGQSDYMVVADSPSLQLSTNDFLFAVVTAYTTPLTGRSGYGMLYSKQDPTDSPYIGPCLVGNTQVDHTGALQAQVSDGSSSWVVTSEADFNDGVPFYVTVHRFALGGAAGAELLVRVNGADAGSASGSSYGIDVSAVGFPLNIGGTPAQQDVLGFIAEVVAASGPVGAGDVDALEGYLKRKYAL